ncbi:glycosyltransferase [Pontibacter chitinilyticus]|uniref:glycosyltransferase n=1 Tax=Pontibacter chitinilyticus TaxID=2674989 RepID=UPI003219415D
MISNRFISIIIPTYHDWDRLSLCIDALAKQEYPKELFEVIIVNNDPNDPVPQEYSLPENFKIVHESAPGSYAARNRAISIARGEIYGFTDSDCIPYPTWIKNAVQIFDTKSIDRIAGHIELFYQDDADRSWVELYESVYSFNQKRAVNVLKGAVTANLFVKKELFEKVGVFDCEKKSGEDIGWNRRANEYGYSLMYAENVIIRHPARSTFKAFKKKKLRVFGGIKKFRTDWLSIIKNFLYLPFLFYMTVIYNTFLLFKNEKRLTFIEKLKVTGVNTYLFFIYAVEFFRLMFGGERVR